MKPSKPSQTVETVTNRISESRPVSGTKKYQPSTAQEWSCMPRKRHRKNRQWLQCQKGRRKQKRRFACFGLLWFALVCFGLFWFALLFIWFALLWFDVVCFGVVCFLVWFAWFVLICFFGLFWLASVWFVLVWFVCFGVVCFGLRSCCQRTHVVRVRVWVWVFFLVFSFLLW